LKTGSSAEKLKLLNFVERGRLYDFLKNSDERHGPWNDVCQTLGVCRKTVHRYIDFFNIIQAYPRLLVCELSFELIMGSYKQLNAYFHTHESLEAKLKVPLKQTRICGGCIFSSRKMPGGDDELHEAPQTLETGGASWDPTWQFTDELFDSE